MALKEAQLNRQRYWQLWQFWPSKQQALLSDLYALISDGVPLVQAIDTVTDIQEGIIKQASVSMADALSQGHSLASGMEDWFPPTIVEIIRAGEEGGMFKEALQSAMSYYETRVSASKVVIQSMLYPCVVIVLALVMSVVIKNSVLTDFAHIKPVGLWPSVGQELFSLANFVEYWWWLAGLCLVTLFLFIYYMLKNTTGDWRYKIDKLPLLSLYRNLAAANFMKTLGLLVTNGVMLKEAFQIMHQNAEPYLSWHLMLMEYRLSSGAENIADVLDTKLIQRNDMLRLRIISKGKGFEAALMSLGSQALARYARSVELTAKVAGGLLLISGALLAAMMVFGIYSVGTIVAS